MRAARASFRSQAWAGRLMSRAASRGLGGWGSVMGEGYCGLKVKGCRAGWVIHVRVNRLPRHPPAGSTRQDR